MPTVNSVLLIVKEKKKFCPWSSYWPCLVHIPTGLTIFVLTCDAPIFFGQRIFFFFLSFFVPELILFLKTVGRATRCIAISQEQFSNNNQGQLVYRYVSTLSLRGLIQSSYFFYMVSLSSQKDEPLVIRSGTQMDDLPFTGFLLFLFSLSLPY